MTQKNARLFVVIIIMLAAVAASFVLLRNEPTHVFTIRAYPENDGEYVFYLDEKEIIRGSSSTATIKSAVGIRELKIESNNHTFQSDNFALQEETKTINVQLSPKNSDRKDFLSILSDTTDKSITIEDGYSVSDVVYFDDKTWAYGRFGKDAEGGEGEDVLVKKVGQSWKIVIAGTNILASDLREEGVPEPIITEIIASRRQ